MRGWTGLDTQGERSVSLPECLGTGPDRSLSHKQDSCEFHTLNTVTYTFPKSVDVLQNLQKPLFFSKNEGFLAKS